MRELEAAIQQLEHWLICHFMTNYSPIQQPRKGYTIHFLVRTEPLSFTEHFQAELPGDLTLLGRITAWPDIPRPWHPDELAKAIQGHMSANIYMGDEYKTDNWLNIIPFMCKKTAHEVISKATKTAFNSWRENAPRLVRKPTSA